MLKPSSRRADTCLPSADSARTSLAEPARLCALNFGIQVVWGAILAVSLQARSLELGGQNGIGAYAMIASVGAALATITQVVVGRIADRRRRVKGHRREFYVIGIAGAVPALLWFFVAPSFGQLLAAFLTLQIMMNVAGPYSAAIPDYVEETRSGVASGWMSAYQSLGNAAGLVIAGFVADLRLVAGLLAGMLVATCAITVAHVRSRPVRDEVGPATLVTRSLIVLLISRGLINLGFFTLVGFLLFYVHDSLGLGEAKMQTALLFLTFTLMGVVGALLAAGPTDRYDKRAVVTATMAVFGIALLLLTAATSLPAAFFSSALAGIGWGGFVSADWALACALLPKGAMAGAMGVWNIGTAGPQIFAPLVAAPLVAAFNARTLGAGPRAAIVLALLESVVGTFVIWRLPRTAASPYAVSD